MATWTRRESTVRRIEHVLPTPANHAALYQALNAAERHYRRNHTGTADDHALADDALTITVTDEAVVISYDIDADMPTPAPKA
ncbi:hypothetical protein [Kitasatospora sp. NPDC086791]|uniref:hypothetical protein n=1 Tax=Kitasatospora sp. NPDC086791 TaxID=3155178 RepID=UPI00343E0B31